MSINADDTAEYSIIASHNISTGFITANFSTGQSQLTSAQANHSIIILLIYNLMNFL